MKKLFLLVAVGAAAISCNNAGETKSVTTDSTVVTDSSKVTTDTTKVMGDTSAIKKDSAK